MLDKTAGIGSVAKVSTTMLVASGAAPRQRGDAVKTSHVAVDMQPPHSDVLAMAAEIARESPPVDKARVAALREAIASGHYSINVAATALAIANAVK